MALRLGAFKQLTDKELTEKEKEEQRIKLPSRAFNVMDPHAIARAEADMLRIQRMKELAVKHMEQGKVPSSSMAIPRSGLLYNPKESHIGESKIAGIIDPKFMIRGAGINPEKVLREFEEYMGANLDTSEYKTGVIAGPDMLDETFGYRGADTIKLKCCYAKRNAPGNPKIIPIFEHYSDIDPPDNKLRAIFNVTYNADELGVAKRTVESEMQPSLLEREVGVYKSPEQKQQYESKSFLEMMGMDEEGRALGFTHGIQFGLFIMMCRTVNIGRVIYFIWRDSIDRKISCTFISEDGYLTLMGLSGGDITEDLARVVKDGFMIMPSEDVYYRMQVSVPAKDFPQVFARGLGRRARPMLGKGKKVCPSTGGKIHGSGPSSIDDTMAKMRNKKMAASEKYISRDTTVWPSTGESATYVRRAIEIGLPRMKSYEDAMYMHLSNLINQGVVTKKDANDTMLAVFSDRRK